MAIIMIGGFLMVSEWLTRSGNYKYQFLQPTQALVSKQFQQLFNGSLLAETTICTRRMRDRLATSEHGVQLVLSVLHVLRKCSPGCRLPKVESQA